MTDSGLPVAGWVRRAAPLALCALCLARAGAADGASAISIARMSGRTAVEASRDFFRVKSNDRDDNVDTFMSFGLGFLRPDSGHDGEGRVHVDTGIVVNSACFQVGGFVTSGRHGGPALGVRFAAGWRPRGGNGHFVGGYWEYAAALPGAGRGSRAGLGVQVGVRV